VFDDFLGRISVPLHFKIDGESGHVLGVTWYCKVADLCSHSPAQGSGSEKQHV